MHCVYRAYCQHLRYLGLEPMKSDWHWYSAIKRATQNMSAPTWGGIVPLMIKTMARAHSLTVHVQYRIWTPAHYEADADNWRQRLAVRSAVRLGDFGEEAKHITLRPAIYLSLASGHASFAEVAVGQIVMALRLTHPIERVFTMPAWANL